MATIANLLTNSNGIPANARSDKGLVLGPKEGFYRQLPDSLFSGTRARIAIAFSFVPNNDINPSSGPSEYLNSSYLSDTFFFGFKYPSNQLPGATTTPTDCFAGVWLPPAYRSPTFAFQGYSGSQNGFSASNGTGIFVIGTTTSPVLWPGLSASGTSGTLSNSNFKAPCTQNHQLYYQGIQLNSSNILTTQINSSSPTIGSTSPTLSSLKTFLNSNPFNMSSTVCDNNPWNVATAIFLYNPFNTIALRVHAMGAAGFTD